MSNSSTRNARFPLVRRLWKPAAVTGAGSTAAAFWIEEILVFAAEALALILLPIMAGIIYLLDIAMFRSRMPRREDLHIPTERGEKN